MIDTDDLLAGARRLCRTNPEGEPRQADLRRALSTAYYALFHRLLQEGADRLAGSTAARRETSSWLLVYRAYNHGDMARRCAQVSNPPAPLAAADFPQSVQRVASEFKALQNDRHRADYDPRATFRLSDVQTRVRAARTAVRLLDEVSGEEGRLFMTFLLLGVRTSG